MKIREQHIIQILKEFDVSETVSNVIFLLEGYKEANPPRIKVIARVELDNGFKYIVKCVSEQEHPVSLIEEQSRFSECLRMNGIQSAKRLKKEHVYCIPYTIDGLLFAVTVEEYLGEEIKCIDYNTVNDIATLMASTHNVSLSNNCHISNNTIWDIFDNKTDIMRGYMKFYEVWNDKNIDLSKYNVSLYNEIIKLYNKRKARLKDLWGKLPKYATQGDFSINNLSRINNMIGVFDYNIAGDEVLVNDMIIEGLFITKEMDLCEDLTDRDREGLFKSFVKTYMQSRKMTVEEIEVMNDIYAIVYPFWWVRIIFDKENSFLSLLEEENVDTVNKFLKETYSILSSDYFDKM